MLTHYSHCLLCSLCDARAADPPLEEGTFKSVMSFGRSQLFSTYQNTISTGFAVVVGSLLLLGAISAQRLRKVLLIVETTAKVNSKDEVHSHSD